MCHGTHQRDDLLRLTQRGAAPLPQDVHPVSYTHLDVYKRQVFLETAIIYALLVVILIIFVL